MIPAYIIEFGKHRLPPTSHSKMKTGKNKAWMENFGENDKALFFRIYKENNSTKVKWLNEKQERERPADERMVVYLKSTGQTYALPTNTNGLINDLETVFLSGQGNSLANIYTGYSLPKNSKLPSN